MKRRGAVDPVQNSRLLERRESKDTNVSNVSVTKFFQRFLSLSSLSLSLSLSINTSVCELLRVETRRNNFPDEQRDSAHWVFFLGILSTFLFSSSSFSSHSLSIFTSLLLHAKYHLLCYGWKNAGFILRQFLSFSFFPILPFSSVSFSQTFWKGFLSFPLFFSLSFLEKISSDWLKRQKITPLNEHTRKYCQNCQGLPVSDGHLFPLFFFSSSLLLPLFFFFHQKQHVWIVWFKEWKIPEIIRRVFFLSLFLTLYHQLNVYFFQRMTGSMNQSHRQANY